MWRAELYHMASSSVPRPNGVCYESHLGDGLLCSVIERHMVYYPTSLPLSKFCFLVQRNLQQEFLVIVLFGCFLDYSHLKN